MTVRIGESITFANKSEAPEGTTWLWTFGDGDTSKEKEPTHKYAKEGIYKVRLTAKVPNLDPVQSRELLVEVKKATAFTPPSEKIYIGQEFQFKNPNPPRPGETYKWLFGDGNSSGEHSPTHYYKTHGSKSYTWTLTVGGIAQVFSGTIEIHPITPKVSSDSTTVNKGDEFQFKNDTEGPPNMEWEWDFGDDSPKSNEKEPYHVYEKDGGFEVTLTVKAPNVGPLYSKLKVIVKPVFTKPAIGSITIDRSEMGADGNYTAKIIVEATGTYEKLQLKVDGDPISGISPSEPQSSGDAEKGTNTFKHTFKITVPTPPTSVTQEPVAEKLKVTATIFPDDPADEKKATGYAKTETLNLTLIPKKPWWLLYVYILAGCILLAIIITLVVLAKRPVIPGTITLNGADHYLTSSPLGPKKGKLEIDLGNLDSDYDGFVMTVSAEKRSNSTQLRINSAINSKNGAEGEVAANSEYFDFGRGFPCVEVMTIEWPHEERGRLSLIYDTHQSDSYDYGDDQDDDTYEY
ncbi:PKD domain-containing protein [Verrucomicrobia bacterium]|nr:PKD domain-containing protein [Verrucomicrobiota bacterium]